MANLEAGGWRKGLPSGVWVAVRAPFGHRWKTCGSCGLTTGDQDFKAESVPTRTRVPLVGCSGRKFGEARGLAELGIQRTGQCLFTCAMAGASRLK